MKESGDTLFNKDKFCCVCFCEDHLQDLFLSRYLEHHLFDLIKIYMDVVTHDLLKTICINCLKCLIRTHNFLKQCKEASTILRNYILRVDNTEQLETGNAKLLQEPNKNLFIRKYNLAEFEGRVRAYVIACCDKNTVISGEDVIEDDDDNIDVIEEKNIKVRKKVLPIKYFKCDTENLNPLQKIKIIEEKSKEIFYDKLDTVQNNTMKSAFLNNANLNFADIKEIQKNDIRLMNKAMKLEKSDLNMIIDTGYSDDDDLPLIIHRDRSLALSAQEDVINEFMEGKVEKPDVKSEYDEYFHQENNYFDAEDKFFESSNDKDEDLPKIKASENLKRNSDSIKCIKSVKIKCYMCDLVFERKSKWRQHLKTEHPNITKSNEYISCDICGKQLKAMCMKTHIKNVHQGRIFKNKFLCPICGKLYNASQRRRHTLLHDTPKPYQCEHCSFRCSQRGNLRRHQRRHTGEKPYLCTVCGHGASQKGTLLEHMRSHEILPSPVSCVFCQLEFATSFEYRRHRRVHKNDIATDKMHNGLSNERQGKGSRDGEKDGGRIEGGAGGGIMMDSNLVCPICKKQLMSESGFKCHVRAHKESGRYRCHHCSKSFTSKATLEYHIRIHTGEKPYRCTACPKRFKQPGHLTAHMAIHANRRDHRCTYCDQTFNIKFNLVEHLRIHTGDTIDCEFCGKKFRHNSNRRKHIRETHPGEVKAVRT